MARRMQGPARWGGRMRVAFGLAAVVTLAGCGARGFSIEDAVPDRTLVTSSIPAQQSVVAGDAMAASDEETIRNAVSSAIIEQAGEDGLGWANASTGSRGAIRQISEQRDGSRLCRRFVASRESFDGVHLYRGETCLGPARIWTMTVFDRVE